MKRLLLENKQTGNPHPQISQEGWQRPALLGARGRERGTVSMPHCIKGRFALPSPVLTAAELKISHGCARDICSTSFEGITK